MTALSAAARRCSGGKLGELLVRGRFRQRQVGLGDGLAVHDGHHRQVSSCAKRHGWCSEHDENQAAAGRAIRRMELKHSRNLRWNVGEMP
jgi:hypothetical protein